MDVLTRSEFRLDKKKKAKEIAEGSLFVYPTDTIYGIGCSAINGEAIRKVRQLKGNDSAPYSIIAPSKDWIARNCEADDNLRAWLDKLPGPYTLILRLRNKQAVSPDVNNGLGTIGVRIPDSWISGFVEEMGVPIISTSANVKGGDFMTTIDDLDDRIKQGVAFTVYEGPRKGRPSTLVDLTKDRPKLTER